LLASIESEREKIRVTWQNIDDERQGTAAELERLRQDTEEWCYGEREKIDGEWKRLDKLKDRMSVLWPDHAAENLSINCSGTLFSIPKAILCSIEGSFLNHMFSDAFIQNIPRDADRNFFLDFNPYCFDLIIKYLRARREKPDAPPPIAPPEHQQNMDMLCEALKLKAFMPINRINPSHGTSLKVSGKEGRYTIETTHPGWQVISSLYPIPMANTAFFEVNVLANSEARGGLAIGICGHIPQGPELHSVRLNDSVMYNSSIGLIGDAFASDNVSKGIVLGEGCSFSIKHDVNTHRVEWFYNRMSIGHASLRVQSLEKLLHIYPVVGLAAVGQKVEINFTALAPSAKSDGSVPPGDDDD
jgi:hypothetical protein